MQYGRYRYRNATPWERFKADVRYAVRAHRKDFLQGVFEVAAGIAWILTTLFVLPILAACLR